MLGLSHYSLTEIIHETAESAIYRGHRKEDRTPVVVKFLKDEYPTPRDVAKLRHEHAIMSEIESPGLLRAYGLEKLGKQLALVMEDRGGRPLNALLQPKLDVATALHVGIALARILESLHQRRIIHKDLKPHNILFNRDTREVMLIDFGSAMFLPQEAQRVASPGLLEGTIAYMSPEQTGRMSRVIDHRSDLYSFGVTLYQMLTGSLPFSASEPTEMVHSHIARTPTPPHEVCADIPEVLSRIVTKLLAKNPEDRYQHARGLGVDLEECLRQWQASGRVEPFPLGRSDFGGELRMSEKLYGRETELAQLLAAWERTTRGATECVLVSGYAGVGKSVLVNEIYKVIARQRVGYFVAGKFEQLGRPIPYAPVAQAFRELVRQILTEPAASLARWKGRFENALGANAGVLAELVPELAILLGPQPSAPELGPNETQHRFALALQAFIHAFADEHPVGIFLDDLQWADPASLKLLELLLSDAKHLLILGAYRDNEIDEAHPLTMALREIEESHTATTRITLAPLSLPSVTRIAADALRCSEEQARPLAELVFEKTHGNPFFVNQLLLSLRKEGLLSFDAQTGSFTWSLAQLRGAGIADNVVDLMLRKMKGLAPATRCALALAACVGHRFDLDTLAIVGEKSAREMAADLTPAIEEGLVLPLDADVRFFHFATKGGEELGPAFHVELRFVHDRVQQAAYALIEDGHKQQTHLEIGRSILAKSDPETIEARLSEIVNHMNIGAALIVEPQEKLVLARLNLGAGKRAKAAAAFKAGAGYLSAGASLLPASCWQDEFELSFAINLALAECEYLCGHFEAAEARFETLSSRAQSRLERANIDVLRARLYIAQGRVEDAMRAGRKALALYGLTLPKDPAELESALAAELAEAKRRLSGLDYNTLLDAPTMTDPDQRAILQLLVDLSSPAYQESPALYALVVTKQVNISLEHGQSEVSAHGFVTYCWINVDALGQDAYELGRVAIELNEKHGGLEVRCKVYMMFGMYLALLKPLRLALEYERKSYSAGMQSGDMLYMAYGAYNSCLYPLCMGEELGGLRGEAERLLAIARRCNDTPSTMFILVCRQMIANLLGLIPDRRSLSDDVVPEAEIASTLEEASYTWVTTWYYCAKLQLAFLYEDHPAALDMIARLERVAAGAKGMYFSFLVTFYSALTFAAIHHDASPSDKERYARTIEQSVDEFAALATRCPESFEHKLLILRAERARISGAQIEAMELYDKAIEAAKRSEMVHEEALANELCARFHLGYGRTKIARAYMHDAHHGYFCWGAKAKVDALAEKHPSLVPSATRALGTRVLAQPSSVTITTTTGRLATGALDAGAVIRASQAIASELLLDNVVRELLAIVLENAGAQRCVLLLDRGGRLMIEASASLEGDAARLDSPLPLEEATDLPRSLVQYVARTKEAMLLADAASESKFAADPYIGAVRPVSVLCLAMVQKGRLTGVLYMENNAARGAFTQDRVEVCALLSSQAAIAIENALLYQQVQASTGALRRSNEELESEVARRTDELRRANEQLMFELVERERGEQERIALQEEIIRVQNTRLQELSTPLMPLTERIMVMPLIGAMDAERAEQVLTTALDGVQSHGTQVMILDITGVKVLDTEVANMLLKTAEALRLLGAQAVLTGVRPEVAQTLVSLGVNLSGLVTMATLRSAVAHALRISGEETAIRGGAPPRRPAR
ncbi:AAA family ATPase [Polyangium aurulentum]|uniref:AAA family ATPase n=1 Tax=Polyangium aurulentum TaxID=2567896 RepID=UPI0010ADAA78|nr:AAA family ATPase [Polyangium aurulentum]UQA59500.1 AAA family ATPase [Polyangium aurulentum]